MKILVDLYTDGSCATKTTNRGGWAALVNLGHERCMLFGDEENSTNNRMEMMAVIQGLKELKISSSVTVHSDSQYVVNTINKWIFNWKRNNWITSSGSKAKNIDLLEEMYECLTKHKVKAVWVKAHNGHLENEICDQLAKSQAFIK